MALDVFVKCIAKIPGTESGDAFWYHEAGEVVWAVVADGLGSGTEAAIAALAAIKCVREMVMRETVPDARGFLQQVVLAADQRLRNTRGAALGVVQLDAMAAEGFFAGIGNVEIRVIGEKSHHPVCTPGIVGAGVSKVRVEAFPYRRGDLLVMHSDGVSSRFDLSTQVGSKWNVGALGEKIVTDHGKTHDDLTLLLVRQYA